MAYSDQVLDHYENPRNGGRFDEDDSDIGTGMVGAPACGDVMRLQIKVGDDGIIQDARFKTYGCGSAIGFEVLYSLSGSKVKVLKMLGQSVIQTSQKNWHSHPSRSTVVYWQKMLLRQRFIKDYQEKKETE